MKGRCVICDEVGLLTRDHVPPKGVVPPEPFELRWLTDIVSIDTVKDTKPRKGFQAPEFPSLCNECNRGRLGSQYDPDLAGFAAKCRAWVRATLDLGMRFQTGIVANIRAGRIARAVVGHLLAAEERANPHEFPPRGTLQDQMRQAFLHPEKAWPADLRVYCWPYNSTDVVIVRGFGIFRVLGSTHGPIVGDVLKFFPLAFWVTQEDTRVTGYQLVDLARSITEDIDGVSRVELPLLRIPSPFWPERPRDPEVILLRNESTFITKRLRKRGAV